MNLDHVGDLVQRALDEFDDRVLEVSARRAYRIARLRGDVAMAHRLQLELRPIGGPDHDRLEELLSLYPELSYEEARARHSELVERWIGARTPRVPIGDNDQGILGGSLAELTHGYEQNERAVLMLERDGSWTQFAEAVQALASRKEVFERIRTYVFDYLVRVETQLETSDPVSSTLARHRLAVDQVLESTAPALRDQLQAALRTARQEGGEHRSQVLTTCRRVLVAIADHLFPPSGEPHVSTDGVARPVGAGQYRNRILAAVEKTTSAAALGAAVGDLATRLDRLDELSHKGVHDEVTDAEMQFGLAQTYFLAGELIRSYGATTANSEAS